MFATNQQGPDEGAPMLYRWILDPSGGAAKEEQLDDRGQEFPRIDERRTGKPYRYGYTTGLGDSFALGNLLKIDLAQRSVETHAEGPGRGFMEPVFVPASADADEDEGWILSYVYDASSNRSDVVILDARDFGADPLATIHLPCRVPFGFHGNWLPDSA